MAGGTFESDMGGTFGPLLSLNPDFFVLAPNWSQNFTECDRISDKFLAFLSGFELLLSECVLGYSFYLHFLTNEIVYNIPFPQLC